METEKEKSNTGGINGLTKEDMSELLIDSLNASERLFVYLSKDNNFLFSDSVENLTGYTNDEINGLDGNYFGMIYNADLRKVKDYLLNAARDNSLNEFTVEYRIEKKDGNLIWVRDSIKIIRDKAGRIEYVIGLVEDVNEYKEKENELIETVNKVKELSASKDKLISIVSHDLRAPFSSLLGFSEILLNEEDLPEAERREYLEYINEAAQTQLQLVNYLLDWSRLQTGKMKIEPRRLDVKNVINNCVSVLTGAAIRKNIEITVNVEDGLYINADDRLINQAVTNLLSNAIKFSHADKKIYVKANRFKEKMIEIMIKDEGTGIEEKNQHKIFKIEEKYSQTGTSGEKGTGLGLALVKEIIEKHNGTIWFYSKENEGSEFHFTIPEANNLVMVITGNLPSAVFSEVIPRTLKDFDTIYSENGYEAMNIIKEKIPSLIILNHHLQLLTGAQLVETLKNKDSLKNIPVIVYSENMNDSVKEKYLKFGINNFLNFPIDKNELAEMLTVSVNL